MAFVSDETVTILSVRGQHLMRRQAATLFTPGAFQLFEPTTRVAFCRGLHPPANSDLFTAFCKDVPHLGV